MPRAVVQLTDPRALRAVRASDPAEAARGCCGASGPLTATQAGEKIGESAASCSFHLRQLAKYGLVEEAGRREGPGTTLAGDRDLDRMGGARARPGDGRRGRGRCSRGSSSSTTSSRRSSGSTVARDEDAEWAEKAVVDDHVVYLTADELAEIGEKARALLDPYLERNEDPAARPDGARPVTYIQLGFPLDEE